MSNWKHEDVANYYDRQRGGRVTKAKTSSTVSGKEPRRGAAPTLEIESAPSKYRSVRTEVDGIVFASRKEAARYDELKQMERGGQIKNLEMQVPFVFIHNGVRICCYYADFRYQMPMGEWVVEDVKGGKRTKEYAIKRKMMRAFYSIEILETW